VRLSRVTIENYTRLPLLDLSLRKHVVIIGPNDVGKTSILRCINFALGATMSALYASLSIADLTDPSRAMRVRASLTDFVDAERVLFPDEISIEPDGSEALHIEVEAQTAPGDDALYIRRHFPEAGHNRRPSRDQLKAIGWRYLPAARGSGPEALEGRNSALRALFDGVDLGDEHATLGKALDEFNENLGESKTLGELRKLLAAHLDYAMPWGLGADDLEIRSTVSSAEIMSAAALFMKRDGLLRSISEQSEGMNALAALAFYDLAATGSNIVAVDEPEIHLHPASQRALAALLAKGSNQKVLSTHSPYVVQKFAPEHVIAFSPDKASRQIPTGALPPHDKVMTHWWAHARLEPLTAKWVLLVEGPADRVIVEAACQAKDFNIDSAGVSVVELNGAGGIVQAHRLFGPAGFNIGMAGLVDEDKEENWAKAFGVSKAELPACNVFIARADLEDEYVSAMTVRELLDALCGSGIFTERYILTQCGVPDVGSLTRAHLRAFCGHRPRKVNCAIAIAPTITGRHVDAMNGVSDAVAFLSKR
jgi:putative ATP-dependent endonuclease of OLD family